MTVLDDAALLSITILAVPIKKRGSGLLQALQNQLLITHVLAMAGTEPYPLLSVSCFASEWIREVVTWLMSQAPRCVAHCRAQGWPPLSLNQLSLLVHPSSPFNRCLREPRKLSSHGAMILYRLADDKTVPLSTSACKSLVFTYISFSSDLEYPSIALKVSPHGLVPTASGTIPTRSSRKR